MRVRHVLAAAAAAVLLVAGSALPAVAQEAEGPVDLGLYDVPIRFEGPDGTEFQVTGGLDGRHGGGVYAGDLAFLRSGEGVTAVNDVSMRTYVEGIAETPVRWPPAALKAQAVAARTYAWYSMELDTYDLFDICATVACQVYAGREHVSAPGGDRWRRAVAETRGEVLVHDGGPILARYFSTSGGATRANEEVFPGEGPVPYLTGVPDPHDSVSPLHRWTVTFTREQMNTILAEGRQLHVTVPVARFEHIPADGTRPDRLRVVSEDGEAATVTASDFRSFVSAVAPDLYPDAFPGRRSDGLRMPLTLPSSRFDIVVEDDEVVVHGRGFGHGVGMSQYGAMGRARAGEGYEDILAAYYGGLRPTRDPRVPERVRVGIATDGRRFGVKPDEPVRVLAGDQVLTERGLGTWQVEDGPDGTMRLRAPAGYGAPLVVSPTAASDANPSEVQVIQLNTVVNKPAELRLTVAGDNGEVVVSRRVAVVDPGRHRVTFDLDRSDGSPLPPGRYRATLEAVDENGTRRGQPAEIDVHAVVANGRPASILGDIPPPRRSVLPAAVAAGVGLAVGGSLALVGRRRATT